MFKKLLKLFASLAIITFSSVTVVSCTMVEDEQSIGNSINKILNKVNEELNKYDEKDTVAYSNSEELIKNQADEYVSSINSKIDSWVIEENLILSNDQAEENSVRFLIEYKILNKLTYNSPSINDHNIEVEFSYSIVQATRTEDKLNWEYSQENIKYKTTIINIKETDQTEIILKGNTNVEVVQNVNLESDKQNATTIEYQILNPTQEHNNFEYNVYQGNQLIQDVLQFEIIDRIDSQNYKGYKGKIQISSNSYFKEELTIKVNLKDQVLAKQATFTVNLLPEIEFKLYEENKDTPIDPDKDQIYFQSAAKVSRNLELRVYDKQNTDVDVKVELMENKDWLELSTITKTNKKDYTSFEFSITPDGSHRLSSRLKISVSMGKKDEQNQRPFVFTKVIKVVVDPTPVIKFSVSEIPTEPKKESRIQIVIENPYKFNKDDLEIKFSNDGILKAEYIQAQEGGAELEPITYTYKFTVLDYGKTTITMTYPGAADKEYVYETISKPTPEIKPETKSLEMISGKEENISISVENYEKENKLHVENNNSNSFKTTLFDLGEGLYSLKVKAISPIQLGTITLTYPNANSVTIFVTVINDPKISFDNIPNNSLDLNVTQTKLVRVNIVNSVEGEEIEIENNNSNAVQTTKISWNSFEVKALKDGQATITVKYSTAIPIQLNININKPEIVLDQINFEFDKLDDKKEATFTIKNYGGNISDIKITPIDSSIVSVSTPTLVTNSQNQAKFSFDIISKNEGNSSISISYTFATTKSISASVTLKPVISIDQNEVEIMIAEKTKLLWVNIANEKPDGKLIATVDDSTIIKVEVIDNNLIKIDALKVGNTNIKLEYTNSIQNAESLIFNFTVYEKSVIQIAEEDKDIQLDQNASFAIKIDILNLYKDSKLEYELSDSKIIEVSEFNNNIIKFKALQNGKTTITLKIKKADDVKINITVEPLVFKDFRHYYPPKMIAKKYNDYYYYVQSGWWVATLDDSDERRHGYFNITFNHTNTANPIKVNLVSHGYAASGNNPGPLPTNKVSSSLYDRQTVRMIMNFTMTQHNTHFNYWIKYEISYPTFEKPIVIKIWRDGRYDYD